MVFYLSNKEFSSKETYVFYKQRWRIELISKYYNSN